MRKAIVLAVFLLSQYGILQAHVVDIHIPTASEIWEDQQREEQREKDKARDVYEDEDASEEDRREALAFLNDKGEIV